MYNGIGLQTPRGSGTNGHVQRNWAFVRPGKKDNVAYKTEEDISKLEATLNRQPNQEILDHERKRKIEVKCAEFEEILEKQGYDAENIKIKIESYRAKLLGQGKSEIPKDDFGRISVRETHQIAEAQQEKNAKLREAFGISEYFVEGTSFDPDRKAKEDLAKRVTLQEELQVQKESEKDKGRKYALVRTPSVEKEVQKQKKESGEKKKKKRKHRETSSSPDRKKEKKKKSKKHKKERSKKKKAKKRKEKHSDSGSSVESYSDNESSDSEEDKKRKKSKKEKKKKDKKKKDRSASVESRASSPMHQSKLHQKKNKEKESLTKPDENEKQRNRNNADEKQKKIFQHDRPIEKRENKNPFNTNQTKISNRNRRRSRSLSERRAHSLSPEVRNVNTKSNEKERSRSRSRKSKANMKNERYNTLPSSEEDPRTSKREQDSGKHLDSQNISHTPDKILKKKRATSRSRNNEVSPSLISPRKTKNTKNHGSPDRSNQVRSSLQRSSVIPKTLRDKQKKNRLESIEVKEKRKQRGTHRDSRSKSRSCERLRNNRKRSATKEKSPNRMSIQQRGPEKRSLTRSPSPKKGKINPFRTGMNRRARHEHSSRSPRNDRQNDSPCLSNRRNDYREKQKSLSRSSSRNNRYSPPPRRRRHSSHERSADRQSTRQRGRSAKRDISARREGSFPRRDYSFSRRDEISSRRYNDEGSQGKSRDSKRLDSRSASPKRDHSARADASLRCSETKIEVHRKNDNRTRKRELSPRQEKQSKSPVDKVRRSISKHANRTPRREDFLKSPIKTPPVAVGSSDVLNKSQTHAKSPLGPITVQGKRTRSNSSSSESSDLSYSPARRDPERYRVLLEQVKKEAQEKDVSKSPKKKTPPVASSSKRNRSKSKDNRRSQNIHPQPRVHLHSPNESDGNESSNEETRNRNVERFIEAIVNEKKNESQKDLQKDMEMLEALKSGIAAKAKEKIKTIEKMATEINEPQPVAQTSVLPLNESNLVESIVAKVTSSTTVAAVAAAVAAEKKSPRSRSQSKHKHSERRSRSGSRSSYTSTSSSSTGSSRSRSRSSGSTRSSRSSRSRSSSSLSSEAHSRSRSRSATRSPSIPRRRGSPSFLDRRRITSKSKYRR